MDDAALDCFAALATTEREAVRASIIVIASEAKQSISGAGSGLDCFVARGSSQ
jgi:hypothetical protein